ncbi:MAG: TraB/GumN family protein [Prevotellaceae bacterium]|jgi:uncharacterized protein YbaP (TraB family)|nr:TraB/GumN family protein [Prevotellaceae bacterium]
MKRIYKLIGRIGINAFAFIIFAGCISCIEAKTKDFETAGKFSLLWEITGNNLQKPSYLYGSIHIYDSAVFRIPREVYEAIDLCDNFALEVDISKIDQFAMMKRIMITNPDSTLDKLLEPKVYAEMLKAPIIKLMGQAVNNIKPIFISAYLLIENPLAIQSVDIDLNGYAKNKSKNILEIETMNEQLDMIDNISLSEQAQGIKDLYDYCKRENLGFLEAGKKMFGLLMNTYKNQDFDKLVSLEDEFNMTSGSPVADSAILAVRNINMADRISDIVKQDKTLFVVLGALHLPDYKNLRGVVALMKEKGYNMRPVLINLNIE